ncbi:hypothetical protein QTO34_006020 [Cnephaeus nilssonii]|uniref:5-hydroxytryptamine receptor 7 n=1 Tax=Cnephaeus nilssonii TaxID=3371016 RepID=A0AA40HMT7_CNENI|nr:hypothetical protein QTO34_006020 [Eptesicus nilssonii]
MQENSSMRWDEPVERSPGTRPSSELSQERQESPMPGAVGVDSLSRSCGGQITFILHNKMVISFLLTQPALLDILAVCSLYLWVCFCFKLNLLSVMIHVSSGGPDSSHAIFVLNFMSQISDLPGPWYFVHCFLSTFLLLDILTCGPCGHTVSLCFVPRYLGITRPLTYPVRQNGKCMAKMILSVWLLSASITLPPLFGWAQNVNDDKVCLISQDFGYTIYSTAVAFYIPMSVMLFMYYQIYKAARKSAAKHKFPGFPRHPEPDSIISLNGMVKLQKEVEECANLSRLLKHERKNISIFKREQKAATTLGIIVGAFTVCWLPFFLLSTARPFICGTSCSCIPLWVERTFLWLGYANSLINPFIYAFFNRDLRTTYRSLLQCQYRNINRKLSAAGMHEALKLAERPDRAEFVL